MNTITLGDPIIPRVWSKGYPPRIYDLTRPPVAAIAKKKQGAAGMEGKGKPGTKPKWCGRTTMKKRNYHGGQATNTNLQTASTRGEGEGKSLT